MTETLGPYELGEALGRGTSAVVRRARDARAGREVALKLLEAGEGPAGEELRRRFLREARLTAALRHPSIVAVLEHGEHDGRAFIALELVEGETLLARLERVADEAARRALVPALLDVALALDHAHRAGVVHRDVKPGNVLLDRQGRARLADFGLARDPGVTQLTREGQVLGTPSYLAPEVVAGAPASPRGDVYGLGATLYHVLAGRPPFEGDAPWRVALAVLHEAPRPLRALAPSCPAALAAVVERAMARDPARRHASAADLARDLRRALDAPDAAAPDAPAARDPLLGARLSGCALEEVLGRGGTGTAFRARREADGQPVVVKVLAPELAAVPALRARFLREAETLARLRPHPAVVRVLGSSAGDDAPHLVMEHVAGASLQRLLEERGPLPPLEAARAARDVAAGLAAVHEQGVLHRDVKPANIIVGPDGGAVLVDFGAAKDAFRTALTRAGAVVGTPAYVAPERRQEQAVALDPRVDVYGLGATLFQALTGAPPAPDDATPPPGLPPDLAHVLGQMLAPDPRRRYARAVEVAEDLDRVLRGEAPAYPCLVHAPTSRRFPLGPGDRFVIGRDPTCEVALSDPALSRRHAEVRREGAGWVVTDLESRSGTHLNDARAGPAAPLRDGDVVRVGSSHLRFEDPRAGAAAVPWWTRERRWSAWPAPVLDALAAAGDPRLAAAWLEHLAEDGGDRLVERLAPWLGPAAAAHVVARRASLVAAGRAEALRRLRALAGRDVGDAAAWAAWWLARGPDVALGPPDARGLRVRVRAHAAEPEVDASTAGTLLVGRDEKCALHVPAPELPRLAATLHRLHTAFVVETPAGLAIVGPGGRHPLAGGLRLHVDLAPTADDGVPVDAATLAALVAHGHPAALRACRADLAAVRDAAWVDSAAATLGDRELAPAIRAALARRALAARACLTALAGPDATAWQRLEEAVPQAVVAGWRWAGT